MNLISFKHREDYGTELYVQVFNFGKYFPRPLKNSSLLQFSFGWMEFPSNLYVQVTIGSGGLFGLIFMLYKFSFDLDILSRTWDWNYMKEWEEGDDIPN